MPYDDFFNVIAGELDGPRDLLIYVHVPFCSSKCPFCDFMADLSVPDLTSGPSTRDQYVAALCEQISSYGPRLTALGFRLRLVYWGGGTPSILSADQLARVIATLSTSFDLSGVEEHSFESSPETLSEGKVVRLRQGGVNRISVGVQSFVDSELRRSGRSHSAERAVATAGAIRAGGVVNFNIDLIAGLPGQSLSDLRHSIDTCVDLGPTHVTVYPFRADARTVMARQIARGDRPPPSLADLIQTFDLCRTMLTSAGYQEYALGHFALTGYRFRGESYYFDLRGEYMGFGSGAGSSIGHHKVSNSHRIFRRYREDPLTIEIMERFSPHNLGIMAKDLRLCMLNWGGIDFERFERLFGFPFAVLRDLGVFQDYLSYFRLLGAEIVEDERGMRVTDASKRGAHVRSLVLPPEYVYQPSSGRPHGAGMGMPLGAPVPLTRT